MLAREDVDVPPVDVDRDRPVPRGRVREGNRVPPPVPVRVLGGGVPPETDLGARAERVRREELVPPAVAAQRELRVLRVAAERGEEEGHAVGVPRVDPVRGARIVPVPLVDDRALEGREHVRSAAGESRTGDAREHVLHEVPEVVVFPEFLVVLGRSPGGEDFLREERLVHRQLVEERVQPRDERAEPGGAHGAQGDAVEGDACVALHERVDERGGDG